MEAKVFSENGDFAGLLKKEKKGLVFYPKDEVTFNETGGNKWGMYNLENEFLGTIERDKEAFKIYDNNGKYLGAILSNNGFRPVGSSKGKVAGIGKPPLRKVTIEAIRLYYGAVKAIDAIK